MVLFSILVAFASNWAMALYLSWNPVCLVTIRHLKLSDLLYLAAITENGPESPGLSSRG
jgi:hypothetical protein